MRSRLLAAPGLRRAALAGCALAAAWTAGTTGVAGEAAPGDHNGEIRHGGIQRTYRLHVPPKRRADGATPLVIALHGGGGTGSKMEQLTLGNNEDPNPRSQQPFRIERTETDEIRIYKELSEFHPGSLRTIKQDDNLVLIGCPTDRAIWQAGECICQDTGERGCTELHSITIRLS